MPVDSAIAALHCGAILKQVSLSIAQECAGDLLVGICLKLAGLRQALR